MPSESSPPGRPGHLLDRLISEHSKAVLAYTESMLNDRQLAEDIVQETLIRAWQHLERLYSTEGSIRGWLLTVARNLAIDRMRSAAVRHEIVGAEHQDLVQPDHADAVLTSTEIVNLLRPLSRDHQEVLIHLHLMGRTVPDTARVLGIPAGTVKSRQHYALDRLSTGLQQPRSHRHASSRPADPDRRRRPHGDKEQSSLDDKSLTT